MSFKKMLRLIKNKDRFIYKSSFYIFLLKEHFYQIPDDIKEKCYEKSLEDTRSGYSLRRFVKDLPEVMKRRAEEKCIEGEDLHVISYLFDLDDIPNDIREKLEKKLKILIKKMER